MAEYVCPFCGDTNAESPDSEELDPMMECSGCGGSHLHRRYPNSLDNITARDFAELIDDGLTWPEAGDYLMTEIGPFSQNRWATRRDVNQQSVSENVAKAREKLNE